MHYTNILCKCYIVLLEQIKRIIQKHFWRGVNMKKNDKNKTDNFMNVLTRVHLINLKINLTTNLAMNLKINLKMNLKSLLKKSESD